MKWHCSGLIGVICFLGVQGVASAGGQFITTVQDGDWSDPDTWDLGVPDAGSGHQTEIAHVVAVTTAGQNTNVLSVGIAAGTGTLNITSGDLTVTSSQMQIANGGTGTVNLSGGTLNTTSLRIGFDGAGFFNMSGGNFAAGTVSIPDAGPGDSASFVLSGGTMTLSGVMTIGDPVNSSPGSLTIEGGAGSFDGTNFGNDGTVHFTSESTLVIRPDGPTPNTNLTRFDVGTVNIEAGATLELDPLYTPEVGDNWFIFISQNVVGGSAAIFTNVVTPPGITISQSVVLTRGVVVGPEKLTVTVTAVPTPTTWVDFGFGDGGDGSELNPWNTLAEGLADISAGGIVNIKGDTGTSATIETPTINQDVTLVAPSGPVFIGLSKGRAAGDSSPSGFVSRGNGR